MVSLTLLHPQSAKPLRQWRFRTETLVRIGRAPENHVILNDPVVSRFHLEIRRIESPPSETQAGSYQWQMVNHSLNGTFLDGAETTEAILEENALLQLAQDGPLLRFQLEEAPPTAVGRNNAAPVAAISSPPLSASANAAPTRCTHAGNSPDNLFCIHCGQPIEIQKSIRQYQVLRILGRGGMGTTYLVWNADATAQGAGIPKERLQVLKEMNADIARIPKAQELFEREASTLKTLNHPGIPKYFDFFVEDGKKLLVMELIHGRDLEKYVRSEGGIPTEQAIVWMIQTCEILDYLHTRPTPIIHRDIKPGNLLIRNLDRKIVLLDFGAVKAAGMPPGTRIGAEGYSAPEQIQGRPTPQSDLYSIGPSLAYLLTGMHPLRLQKREDSLHRLDLDKINGLSRRLQLVIQRVTEPNPRDRYQTAKELIRALKSCL